MRQLRSRTRRALWALVTLVVMIGLWCAADALDPVQRARRLLIAQHERTAAIYEEEVKGNPFDFSNREPLGILARRSIAWHSLRARALRADPGFDPTRERLLDEATDPLTPEQRAWVHEAIARDRDRRLL